MRYACFSFCLAVVLTLAAFGQTNPPTPPGQSAPARPGAAMTPAARLNAAKSVFIKKTGPSDLAVKVFVNSLEGWGRYAIVDDAAKADLIIEIAQPEDTSGTTFSTSTRTNGPGTPHQEHSTTTTRQLSMQPIKVTVLDPRSNLPFWTAIERPAMAMRQTAKENNIAAAAQKIFDRFHAVVEAASRMGNRPQAVPPQS